MGDGKTPEATGVEEIDYKAKYEEALAHSRKWEARAKENAKSADDLKEDTSKIEEANAKLGAAEAEKERARWVATAAKATGVPADVLASFAAESAEDLMAKAEAAAAHFKRDTMPVVPGDGTAPEKRPVDDERAFVRALTGKAD